MASERGRRVTSGQRARPRYDAARLARAVRDARCGDCEQPRCVCADEPFDDIAWLPGLADHDIDAERIAECGRPREEPRPRKARARVRRRLPVQPAPFAVREDRPPMSA